MKRFKLENKNLIRENKKELKEDYVYDITVFFKKMIISIGTDTTPEYLAKFLAKGLEKAVDDLDNNNKLPLGYDSFLSKLKRAIDKEINKI